MYAATDSTTFSGAADLALMQARSVQAGQAANAARVSQTANATATGKTVDIDKVREKAEEFEGFFLSQMYQQMFEGIGVNETFGGGKGEEMFRSMLIDEYGKLTARSGGIGIADSVMRTMLESQGMSPQQIVTAVQESK